MVKIYTRTGDKGETGLFGGKRVSKDSVRLHAYGTIDELNAVLGLVISDPETPEETADQLSSVQLRLFLIGSDLATPLTSKAKAPRLPDVEVKKLEYWIDQMDSVLEPLTAFILPSGARPASHLHLARTVCRRAERWIVTLQKEENISPSVVVYVNRLSDFLFMAARYVNARLGAMENTVDIGNQVARPSGK